MKIHVKILSVVILFFQLVTAGHAADHSRKARYKVLVVMSYDETSPWCRETKVGIDDTLSASHQVSYFFMNTKNDFAHGPQKAKEAFALFQALRPDGVIAADDNAQSMFVVPYLKDRVKTPVMFCGVNFAPEKYGYPAQNVSGILERTHIKETIAFARQLVPSIKTVGFIGKNSPSNWALQDQVNDEYSAYPAKFVDFKMPETQQETLSMVRELKDRCDLLFIGPLQGIIDDGGRSMGHKDIMTLVADTFEKPIVGGDLYSVQLSGLCAVVKSAQEQGATAAKMLVKAMAGTPVGQIPIVVNTYGKRYINVTVMKKLGIKPKPLLLKGTELVRTEP